MLWNGKSETGLWHRNGDWVSITAADGHRVSFNLAHVTSVLPDEKEPNETSVRLVDGAIIWTHVPYATLTDILGHREVTA